MKSFDAYCRRVQATEPHWNVGQLTRAGAHARHGYKMAQRAVAANKRADNLDKELKRLRKPPTDDEIEAAAVAMFRITKGTGLHGEYHLLHEDVQKTLRFMATAALIAGARP